MDNKSLATHIEYHGRPGITQSCLCAVVRLIHAGETINCAKLLTCEDLHAFLLKVNNTDLIAIRAGFSSGYSGEGPRGLSAAIQILLRHNVELDELLVKRDIIERIDQARLRQCDLALLKKSKPVRPIKFYDYILNKGERKLFDDRSLSAKYPKFIPFSMIDIRILDLALKFEHDPDASLLTGFRRLEQVIRDKTGLDEEHGVKLLSKAFHSENPPMYWPDLSTQEQKGRGTAFTSIFMAFRNRRAHREQEGTYSQSLREFLLLNELFLMEAETSVEMN